MKLGIIGGGNMGGLIAFGAIHGNICTDKEVSVSHPKPFVDHLFTTYNYTKQFTNDNLAIVQYADVIVLGVKPWLVQPVLEEINQQIDTNKHTIISVAAGITFDMMQTWLQKDNISLCRVIPNTAMSVKESTTFIASKNLTEEKLLFVEKLFKAMGKVFFVTEQQMPAYTSLSSCGIAYALKYIDSAIKGGIALGINEQQAQQIVLQTIKGAVAVLEANNTKPQIEIDKVTTPGGITLKGLNAMEKNGFTHAIIEGLKASM